MEGLKVLRNLAYACVDDKVLLLDLYLPQNAAGLLPVIVWIHGGAWQSGNKENPPAARMAGHGYAVASISYRLSQEAIFPAQIHDCKAAVRWLRAHAGQYNLDPERIGAWGGSAGGHLAALLGTSDGVSELEGDEGNPAYSSRVQAVCDFFGPTDFLRMNDVLGTMDHDSPDSPESLLLGGPIRENVDKVMMANPITYIRPGASPFLIVHGDCDLTVLLNQSQLLYEALQEVGIDATFHLVPGAGHLFQAATPEQTAEINCIVDAFFDEHLKLSEFNSQTSAISEAT